MHQHSFGDALMLGLTAAMTLWQDLLAVAVILVLAALRAAIVALVPERGAQ